MATQGAVRVPEVGRPPERPRSSRLYAEGVAGGFLAALTITLWFVIVDLLSGRDAFDTPAALGAALFERGKGIESVPSSAQLLLLFTWGYTVLFMVLGGLVSRLIGVAERRPRLGFGILLLFVYLEGALLLASFLFARPILHTLAWPTVLVGNLLAAAVMAAYFWRRHPHLRIPA